MVGGQRAALGGYQDWLQGQAINQLHTGQDIGQVGNFAAGTAQVFPYKMYQAQHSQDELAFWGSLIASIGGSAANYAQMFGGSGPNKNQLSRTNPDYGGEMGGNYNNFGGEL